MASPDPRAMIEGMLRPWHEAVDGPPTAQMAVLQRLVGIYACAEYGAAHHAASVSDLDAFRRAFPIITYDAIKPLIARVMAGETHLLLDEPPIGWAITRGSTTGESKFIPMTPNDMRLRVSASRAMLNYVATRTPIRSLPTQEEIDALGGGKTVRDWEARFELAYERCRDENVVLVGGVAPTAIRFARYLRHRHGVYPKDLWRVQILTLGSVPGINTRYRPALHALYGRGAIREIYGTTEGMFGQQRDEHRAWVPNYDLFFFEVLTRRGIKMLHEMRPGELGSLVVSTPVLPRYRIGDLILALRPPYYRCIGRERWWTPLRYWWGELATMSLGRL